MTETNAAAADLLGDTSPPAPAPVAPPQSGPWVDGAGQLRARLSPEALARERSDYLRIWDDRARSAKFTGENPELFTPATRQAYLEAFDLAARADGMDPATVPDEATARAHAEHLQAVDPRPDDYQPDMGKLPLELPTEKLGVALSELRGFAAAMKFEPTIGSAICSHIASEGPRLAAMSADDRGAWLITQQRMAGGVAELEALVAQAKAALSGAKHNLATDLMNSPWIMSDVWLARTLINCARGGAALSSRGR
jgi:hypothetical protein